MIQIDMPMPENCRMCPACSEYDICLIPIDGKGFGEQNVSEFVDSRPEWCPMKEQKAVEPYKDIALRKRCPKCHTILKGKFCHGCGQEVNGNEYNIQTGK